MNHQATPRFWACYRALPEEVQKLADQNYKLLIDNPRHPSLRLKRVGQLWSVRVGLNYRALALEEAGVFTWVWIGSHADYDQLLRR